jgi:plastocyanin
MHNTMKVMAVAGAIAMGCGGKKPVSSTPSDPGQPAAGGEAVNGCTTFKDLSGESAYSIKWDETIATSADRCVKIKVQQTVGFTGNLTTHPMKASGGTSPNPFDGAIASVSNPGSPEEGTNVAFTAPGTYGYKCDVHPQMTGAVLVVP